MLIKPESVAQRHSVLIVVRLERERVAVRASRGCNEAGDRRFALS